MMLPFQRESATDSKRWEVTDLIWSLWPLITDLSFWTAFCLLVWTSVCALISLSSSSISFYCSMAIFYLSAILAATLAWISSHSTHKHQSWFRLTLFFLIYLLLKFVNFLLLCLDLLQKVALEVWHDVAAAETHLRVLVQACLERLRFVGLGDFRERRFYWIHYILLWLFKIIFQSFNWGLMA